MRLRLGEDSRDAKLDAHRHGGEDDKGDRARPRFLLGGDPDFFGVIATNHIGCYFWFTPRTNVSAATRKVQQEPDRNLPSSRGMTFFHDGATAPECHSSLTDAAWLTPESSARSFHVCE